MTELNLPLLLGAGSLLFLSYIFLVMRSRLRLGLLGLIFFNLLLAGAFHLLPHQLAPVEPWQAYALLNGLSLGLLLWHVYQDEFPVLSYGHTAFWLLVALVCYGQILHQLRDRDDLPPPAPAHQLQPRALTPGPLRWRPLLPPPFGAEAAVPGPTARRPLGKSPQPDPALAPEKMAVAPGAALRR